MILSSQRKRLTLGRLSFSDQGGTGLDVFFAKSPPPRRLIIQEAICHGRSQGVPFAPVNFS